MSASLIWDCGASLGGVSCYKKGINIIHTTINYYDYSSMNVIDTLQCILINSLQSVRELVPLTQWTQIIEIRRAQCVLVAIYPHACSETKHAVLKNHVTTK